MDSETKERFDKIEQSLERLTSAVERQGGHLERLEKTVERQGTTLVRLEELVEKGFTSIKEDFNRIDERFDGVETRLERVEGDLKEFKKTLYNQYPTKSFLTEQLGAQTEKIMSREKGFKTELVNVLEQYAHIPSHALAKLKELI